MDRSLETPSPGSYRRAPPTATHRTRFLLNALSTQPAHRLIALLLVCFLAGCARGQKVKPPDLELLRSSVQSWHQYIRWGDFRGAQKFLAPERRFDFLKELLEREDDENLKINEFELEDAQLLGRTATALSKITWHRLPSVVTKTDLVVTHWEYREGAWYIVGIENGPIPMEKKPGTALDPAAQERR